MTSTSGGAASHPARPALRVSPTLDALGDLPVRALDAVAQPDGLDPAVLVAGPGVHRHRVGVIEEERARFGDFADVFAEVEQGGDGALRVHDAAGAERVADALVDAVLERDVDVDLEGLEPALADRADDVIASAMAARRSSGRVIWRAAPLASDIVAAKLAYHVQVALGNVHEGEDGIRESPARRGCRASGGG